MNDNAKALYEDLKNSRLPGFDMREWRCGTTCCIGGEAEIRMIRAGAKTNFLGDIETEEIAAWLGIIPHIADSLFVPSIDPGTPWGFLGDSHRAWNATQPEAAEALRRACELSEKK